MNSMFQNCFALEYLDLSNFNTSNVTEMKFVFNKCKKLKEIKGTNNFNTNKVTNMEGMFQKCNDLENLDLSNFDTSNTKDLNRMFYECQKLKEIKGINKFKTYKVLDMEGIFCQCFLLEYLDLSNFDTSNVTNI